LFNDRLGRHFEVIARPGYSSLAQQNTPALQAIKTSVGGFCCLMSIAGEIAIHEMQMSVRRFSVIRHLKVKHNNCPCQKRAPRKTGHNNTKP